MGRYDSGCYRCNFNNYICLNLAIYLCFCSLKHFSNICLHDEFNRRKAIELMIISFDEASAVFCEKMQSLRKFHNSCKISLYIAQKRLFFSLNTALSE